jgi:hypothetical protein
MSVWEGGYPSIGWVAFVPSARPQFAGFSPVAGNWGLGLSQLAEGLSRGLRPATSNSAHGEDRARDDGQDDANGPQHS